MSAANEVDRRLERKALYFALHHGSLEPRDVVKVVYELLVQERDRYDDLVLSSRNVCAQDWSDNDDYAVEMIDHLRAALASLDAAT